MIDKALSILSEHKIEPTSEIIAILTQVENETTSNEEFLENIMQVLARLIQDKLKRSQIFERRPAVVDDYSESGEKRKEF